MASYIVKNSFKPQSLQEALVPFTMYKEEYEKIEDAYAKEKERLGKLKYIGESLPDDSKAKKIYEGFINDFNPSSEDFSRNGLSLENRRAFTTLRNRAQEEIGRLELADTALKDELKRRRDTLEKDDSTLFGNYNLSIDDFLDNNRPNFYSVSRKDLYTRGVQTGQSASSRIYSDPQIKDTVSRYFQDIVSSMGYSPEAIEKFRSGISSLPELQGMIDDIAKEKQIYGNLSDTDTQAALQAIKNGVVNGIVYKETHNVQQNPGVMTAAQSANYALQERGNRMTQARYGLVENPDHSFSYDPNVDPEGWKYNVENGKITGPSDAYKQWLASNGSSAKTDTEELLPNSMYNIKTGEVSLMPTSKTSSSLNLGKEIDFNEASKHSPNLTEEVKKDYWHYKFYLKSNGIVVRVQYPQGKPPVSQTPTPTPTPKLDEEEENGNQV